MRPGEDERRLRRVVFDAWMSRDIAGATRWAARRKDTLDLAREAVLGWAERDAAAASSWACSIPDPDLARQLAHEPIARFAATNPEAAIALVRSLDPSLRDDLFRAILEPLGRTDPARAVLTFGPDLWKGGQGFRTLSGALAEWGKKDPRAMVAWLAAQPRHADDMLGDCIGSFGVDTPGWARGAADALTQVPGVVNRPAALSDLVFRWGTSRPEEAIAWISEISEPDLRINLLQRLARRYYTNNPEKSLPFALAMPEGANRQEALATLLGAWANVDSAATLVWMREHDSEEIGAAAIAVERTLLARIAKDDPQAALAEWQALSNPRSRISAERDIAMAWGERDPGAAFQWVSDRQRERSSYGGYTELLSRWARNEPEAALRWVENWEAVLPDAARDLMPYYYDALGGLRHEKAPRADTANLYLKIHDPQTRIETLSRHVREWLTKDPDAARAWIDATPALTSEERAKLHSAAK